MLQLQPPPRLSFRLPLLFLMDNAMLLSKSYDSFVWKDKKSRKFWRSIFSSLFDSFFQANSLSNNFKYSKVDPKNDRITWVQKRFCLFSFSDALLFDGGALSQKRTDYCIINPFWDSVLSRQTKIVAPACWLEKNCQKLKENRSS